MLVFYVARRGFVDFLICFCFSKKMCVSVWGGARDGGGYESDGVFFQLEK